MNFYRFSPHIRYSHYSILNEEQRKTVQKIIYSSKKLVEILAFALMPNHFHFLLKQNIEEGIPKFISTWQNSYARYFNTKYKRKGSLFCEMFKAVRIESREQLIHVSRYIHLNPVTSFLIKIEDFEYYPYNSFCSYSGKKDYEFINKDVIFSEFRSKDSYRKFVFDQVDYQRKLDRIKHFLLDDK